LGFKGHKSSKIFVAISVGLFFAQCAIGQDETMRILQSDRAKFLNDTLFVQGQKSKLMIVPFEPIMFRTQIGKDIGEASGLDYQQMSANFRRSLDNVLFIESDRKFSVVRMISEEPEIQRDLYAIYGASRPEYRPIPKPATPPRKLDRFRKPKSNTAPPSGDSRIEKGQIVTTPHKDEKFMARVFRDPSLFEYFYGKYETVLYLFINQLEIRPMPNLDYRAFEGDEYQRQIVVHYSIYSDGFEIYSGVAIRGFSSEVNQQKQIILENFPVLAADIVAKLPVVLLAESK
jgi:hypothetical protein